MGALRGSNGERGPGSSALPILEVDGLLTPDVGRWGEDKYRLVANYAQLSARSMQRKWDYLVYVDLYAGSGRSRIRGTARIVPASPVIVLASPATFTRYVFCEKDRAKAEALKSRIRAPHGDRDRTVIVGDANESVDRILCAIPEACSLLLFRGSIFPKEASLRNHSAPIAAAGRSPDPHPDWNGCKQEHRLTLHQGIE